jgi:two-component system, chemotaxis family, CheB/CheR fusion protein
VTDSAPDPDLESLLEWLRESRGFDFTGYKRPSLARRIQRRMQDVGIAGFAEYRDYLELHQDEFTSLFNTILINVTSFFRDGESWRFLAEQVLPDLVARGWPIRVWSAGCATGQEAYSVAMLLAEQLGIDEFRPRVKIYATDVDEDALTVARMASYSAAEVENVDPDRLGTFFERENTRYVFRKDLRRSVIFGRNDLVQDAPISHVDLLLCRNTLMYFNAQTQQRVLDRLHFALEPHGVLFLGKAELLLSHSAQFTPVDLSRRLFRRRDVRPPADRKARNGVPPWSSVDPDDGATVLRQQAWLSSPAAQVVLDSEGRLATSNLQANRLFAIGPRDVGRPFQDLELSYRPVELRSHIEQAHLDRRGHWVRGVELHRPGAETAVLDVQVLPVFDDGGAPLGTTVIFEDVTRYRQLQGELEYANRQLETAYEELQSTNEELETTNEELQSTVEELETTNEELQSTNEELETMNEELQWMNDELHTGNDELRQHWESVASRNDLLRAVLAGLRAGVAVVDDQYRVLFWNAAAEDLWGVREDEALGQALADLDIGLPVDRLTPLLRAQSGADGEHGDLLLPAVNRRGQPIDVQVTVSPLRGDGGLAQGVIVLMDRRQD